MAASLAEIFRLAQESFDAAKKAADDIRLSVNMAEAVHYSREKMARTGARSISHEPGFEDLAVYRGIKAWGALLCFDLRKSSELARLVSPRDMYVIMHTYLPTCLAVIDHFDGTVVGLRGDGAIAAFGLVDVSDGKPAVTGVQAGNAISQACQAADAIVQTLVKVINPILAKGQIKKGKEVVGVRDGKLLVGVGIDVGNIVATKIGLGKAHELTAYGTAVNHCCKRSFANNQVVLTHAAVKMFPSSKGGRTSFPSYTGRADCYLLRYPEDYKTLA